MPGTELALRMKIRLRLHDTVRTTGGSGPNAWELTEMNRKADTVMADINTALAASGEAAS